MSVTKCLSCFGLDHGYLPCPWLRDIEKASILAEQNGMWITCDRDGFRHFCLPHVNHTDSRGCTSRVSQVWRTTIGMRMRREINTEQREDEQHTKGSATSLWGHSPSRRVLCQDTD